MDTVADKWEIVRYDGSMAASWDAFVADSRNSTFLFKRGYMDYHADRFEDCSLMAFRDGRMAAILPANMSEDGNGRRVLHSHQGLTYGGWILPARHFSASDMLELFAAMIQWGTESGFAEIDYKPLPHIYAVVPSEEDLYAMFRYGAELRESNLSATVDLTCGPHLNTLQRRHLRKSVSLHPDYLEARSDSELALFHKMLVECLAERHDTLPVHTLDELLLLQSRFPDNIVVRMMRVGGVAMAGTCIYRTGVTSHAQYIATTPEGRSLNLLTPLFVKVMEEERARGVRYFDFGISCENHGRYLNEGLYRHKASLGASGVVYTRWAIPLGSQ